MRVKGVRRQTFARNIDLEEVVRTYTKGRPIFSAIGPHAPLIVESGWVAKVRHLQDGRRQIVSLVLPSEMIIPPGAGGDASTAAVSIGRVVCRALTSGRKSAEMLESLHPFEREWTENQMVRLGRMDAREKLSHLILEVQSRLARALGDLPSTFPFPLTNEDLGDLLGMTIIHASRTMVAMNSQNLVRLKRRELTILDPEGLAAAAPKMV